MLGVMKIGGLTTGGMNFDAKVRRESFEPIDLFYAHIGGMDAFARGLKIAAAIRADGRIAGIVKNRYSSWDSGIGADVEAGKSSFASLDNMPSPTLIRSSTPAVVRNSSRILSMS